MRERESIHIKKTMITNSGRLLFASFLCIFVCSGREIPDNMGKSFILGFMEASKAQQGNPSNLPLKLFITTSSPVSVTVSITAPLAKTLYRGENITVKEGAVMEVTLPKTLRVLGAGRSNNAVYIVSSDEIVVFGINEAHQSTDGFLGLPVDVLGTQYYVPSFYSNSQNFYKSAILLVGTNDKTLINIRIKINNGNSVYLETKHYQNGDWLNTTINRYEVLQLHCRGDLTGTFVQSSHKISVFGGATVTSIGVGITRDHIEEQIPPLNVWGKQFAVSPIPDTNPNLLRILASANDTTVSVNNKMHNLESGEFYETLVHTAYLVSSNKPILTIQYVPSGSNGHEGDPAMTLVPPREQSNVFYSFLTPVSSTNTNFTNIFMFIMEGSSYNHLLLDNKPLQQQDFLSIVHSANVTTGYIKLAPGSHTLEHSSGIVPFGGILYGGMMHESYAYPIGQRLTPMYKDCILTSLEVKDGLDNDCDGKVDEESCGDFTDNDGDGIIDEDCIDENKSITECTQNILDTTDSTTETAITTGFMRTKRSTTTQFSNTVNIPRTSDKSPMATTKISDIHVQHTRTTPTRLSQTKVESTSTVITDIVNIKKMTFNTITKPNKTMKTTTRKIPTHIIGKDTSIFEALRTQEWLIYTEYAIIGTVTIIIIGALGFCCKKCCILIKREDDDDDNEETSPNSRKSHFKKRTLFMSNSVQSVH